MDTGPDVFSTRRAREKRQQAAREAELYEQIGRGIGLAQKKLPDLIEAKRMMVNPQHPELSIRRHCQLLDLNRSTYYYAPAQETPLNLELMRHIDAQYLRMPFYGYPKRVRRLMRLMGLEAVGPRPRTNVAAPDYTVYAYLLRGLASIRANQVWSTDITYIPLAHGLIHDQF